MGRKKYGELSGIFPENPQLTKEFLDTVCCGLLLALKEEGYLEEWQLRQALETLRPASDRP